MRRRPDNQAVTSATDPIALSAKRVRRLDILVQLRKVYRNLIRAEGLLTLPSPVYQPAGANSFKRAARAHAHTLALLLFL